MFSYSDYRDIIKIVKETGYASDYKTAIGRDRFVIMRHDVEYSVERAYAMSKVEESLDFTSDYFFQWTKVFVEQLAKFLFIVSHVCIFFLFHHLSSSRLMVVAMLT